MNVEKTSSNITSAMKYYNSIIKYMTQLRSCINEKVENLICFKKHLREVAQEELNAADQEKKIAGIAILSFISLVTIIFYFFVKNALSVIRYAVQ